MPRVATPGPQVAPYPGAGVKPIDRLGGRTTVEVLRDGHAADVLIGRNALVEIAEEVAAVVWVVLPGVLAVERDGHKRRVFGRPEALIARIRPIRSLAAARESQL